MPRDFRENASPGRRRWELRLCLVPALLVALSSACRRETAPDPGASSQAQAFASAASAPARVRRPRPAGAFGCQELRPQPEAEAELSAETIELDSPKAGKKLVLSKTGVVVTFDRDEFLAAARCLKFDKAVDYLERETGFMPESPLMDAFQLSYVAAAMLDAGRASVRSEDEMAPRASIARDGWATNGCGGRCRSFGRLYRLSEDSPSFFLRITDNTRDL
jgi:hypothetical protein